MGASDLPKLRLCVQGVVVYSDKLFWLYLCENTIFVWIHVCEREVQTTISFSHDFLVDCNVWYEFSGLCYVLIIIMIMN